MVIQKKKRRRYLAYEQGLKAIITSPNGTGWEVKLLKTADVLGSFSTLELAINFAEKLLNKTTKN